MKDLQTETDAIVVTSEASGLRAFLDQPCAAAIWQREMPGEIAVALSTMAPDTLPSGRLVLRADRVGAALHQLCDASNMPASAVRDWLVADTAMLATLFSEAMDAPYVRMRLDVVTTNACRKFHIDAIMARLVCTYRGTGTQYGLSDGTSDPVDIATVPTGAPILLRGTLWPPQPAAGLLHRSPPIEGTGETRLMLVLDPIFDLDEAE